MSGTHQQNLETRALLAVFAPSSRLAIMQLNQLIPPANPTMQYYHTLSDQFVGLIIKDWTPHPFSDAEIQAERLQCRERIVSIRRLEAIQQRLHPRRDLQLEHTLFLARFDNRTRNGRIFRINDLPHQILENIFHLVVWTAPSTKTGVQWRTALTSVCHRWRIVALENVTLWNAVWFTKFSQYEQAWEYIERAGNSALDIRINDSPEEPLTLQTTTDLITRLFRKLSNIRVLVIVVQEWDPAFCFIHSLLRVGKKGIPMILEHFEIHRAGAMYLQLGSGYQPSSFIRPMALFGGAYLPSLRHITTNGVHLDWEKSVFANLKALDMRRMPLDKVPSLKRFRDMLQQCPSLEKLLLDGAGPGWEGMPYTLPVTNLAPIPLPHLKHLVLGDFSIDYGTYLCTLFTVPNVLDLQLMYLAGHDPSNLFDQLLGKTPFVKTLTLHSSLEVIVPEAQPSIIKWLKSMPHLRYLRVVNMPKEFFNLLLYDANTLRPALHHSNPICPELSYLEYRYLSPATSPELTYIPRWVDSRAKSGSPLLKVFTGDESVSGFAQEQVDNLYDALQGMGVTLERLPYPQKPSEECELIP
ncbi:hypothetical protein CPB84DRAFT_1760436 [Gymnopilus junonius]|uniref:F-box domain-containing protein n=1 Tax=Gymnopilus junonius TaxID=109634 RepID=A0A9P5P3A3_GYMJU|nr:hypothetical protein CPB84DRAFT_1760436 [Gymnopilus junonius]